MNKPEKLYAGFYTYAEIFSIIKVNSKIWKIEKKSGVFSDEVSRAKSLKDAQYKIDFYITNGFWK